MAKNILVIDDDPAIRTAFKLALEDTGYIIDDAATGNAGIELAANKSYHLIFLDLKMPGLNGVETLKKLREIDNKVPIYIVTAFHKEFFLDLKLLRQEGIKFELLRKPLGLEEILMIVNSVLKNPVTYYLHEKTEE